VAFDLFGENGFENVSVETIAAAAGVSRATFFNYFPKKELILREIASSRAEKLKSILAAFDVSSDPPTFASLIELVLKLSRENARIGQRSKKLLLETFFHQASKGLLLAAREGAIESLTEVIARIPRRSAVAARLAAETFFAVYIATMLEWLMREESTQQVLLATMRERLLLVLEGVA
jgi:AcrR family transcriptional regulator